jgi:hypothetical protein
MKPQRHKGFSVLPFLTLRVFGVAKCSNEFQQIFNQSVNHKSVLSGLESPRLFLPWSYFNC